MAVKTSFTKARIAGADRKLTVIACGGRPSGRSASMKSAASSTIATSALRLLGLDPFEVYARLADLTSIIDEIAAEAATTAGGSLDALPATSAPLVEILAEDHATWEVRLFAS